MQVCHIVILIQEGSRFDTQMLKKFRILQAAKHTLAPFVKSQSAPPSASSAHSSLHLRVSTSGSSLKNPSPGKSRGILNRNASSVTVMSGLVGSYASFLPGQCTPVLLFVFLDDFTQMHPSGKTEEPTKGSDLAVVLSRLENKSEGGLRKKLQSSLEAQIRFSIKRCRALTNLENGSRSGAVITSSSPLFSLDSSKAVSLVDSCLCHNGDSLEFAIGLVEKVLDGKATPDSLLLESHHQQNANKDDILSVKEFICKQFDILKGKGGLVVNSGSAGGGMFAAAAAAAAAASASAALRKTSAAPELPTFGTWSSSCHLILHGILSAKRVLQAGENEATSSDLFVSVVSHLETGIGLNAKFSTSWCEKAFPVAKEVYLDNLPPCYPSSQHEDQLNKALCALTSMVKGPAVKVYMKKLKDECTSIWISGRQLCDAVSLTGKPCMHQNHDIETLSEDEIKFHSSGFVYLHACACGRSRRILPDPFDYETANDVYNTFADCDKLLPAVKLPEGSIKGPVRPSSWNLIRIGSAKYYDPLKGLLQSGFCSTQKFLFRWILVLEKLKEEANDSREISLDKNIRVETGLNAESQTSNGVGIKMNLFSNIKGNSSNNGSNVRGLSNFTKRKQFAEVVAGLPGANIGFPSLFIRKKPMQDIEKVKLVRESVESEESQMVENIPSFDKKLGNDNHFPHISSNIVPLINMRSSEQVKAANFMKRVTIFVGFEHECPHGHRFILNEDHLSELGSAYSVVEANIVPSSVENLDKKSDAVKLGRTGCHGRTRRQSNGINMGGSSGKVKNMEKSREKMANGNMSSNKFMKSSRQGKDQNERTEVTDFVKYLDSDHKPSIIDDGGCVLSLLNRSLPIYMNCPHCRDSTNKNDASNLKFASTISQLQRIFLVTPPFPILLAADPIIQFELSCLPPSIPDREKKLQFSFGCPVILPPESFLSLRLPFIYGVELEDGSVHSLKPFENQPQMTAYVAKGTALRVVSNQSNVGSGLVT
ncbi:hypothetical protein OROMI_015251 [Orobanche minor]